MAADCCYEKLSNARLFYIVLRSASPTITMRNSQNMLYYPWIHKTLLVSPRDAKTSTIMITE